MYPKYLILTSAWVVVLYLMFSGFTYREDFKIGYVYSDKIFTKLQEAIEIQKKIEAEQQELTMQLKTKEEDFNKKLKQYENQQLMLSDTKKAEFEKDLTDMRTELINFQQTNFDPQSGTLAQKWSELMKPVVDKIQGEIDKIGTEEEFDIIFDVREGISFILYAKDEYNITERIIEELEKQ